MFKPRPKQQEILQFKSGRMGIPAVPGSGKTHTLSHLAAQLISRELIADDQEILIVTLVNSAVENFSNRIAVFVKQAGLLQKMGYRVRTLHGLAHDIIRERPDLAGVSEQFSIADENECHSMIERISMAYINDHPELQELYLDPSIDLLQNYRVKKQWYSLFADIGTSFIKQAKDFSLDPPDIKSRINNCGLHDPLLDFGLSVYTEYQRGLRFRNALDFTDLTRLAIRVLDSDEDYLRRLQYRWPYILEDEAQDSSLTQETILRKLVGENGNWVRVGDTNQAIYDTFTTANPKFLRSFLQEENVVVKDLPNSGRSNLSIISLANYLVEWTNQRHPILELRNALSIPFIEPAPPGDPQPNPPDHNGAIYIQKQTQTPDEELNMVCRSLKKWLPDNPEKTVAILCPTNLFAKEIIEKLQENDLEVVEMLQSSDRTRKIVRLIEKCLTAISEPSNIARFCVAYEYFVRFGDGDEDGFKENLFSNFLSNIRKVKHLENLLYPEDKDLEEDILDKNLIKLFRLDSFLTYMRRWQASSVLPIDQFLLILGNDLFYLPQDLALVHKLSLLLDFSAQTHQEYRLPQFISDLSEISGNERKFQGFSEDDNSFNPEAHKGQILVTTYHKAKGLEWDRVYLMSVNNYDFPSFQENDQYKGEKYFIRDRLNLEAELLAKLEEINEPKMNTTGGGNPGFASISTRLEYAAERLRLLYVGITRAKESLIITWNTGKRNNCEIALPLIALSEYVEGKKHAPE